MNFCDKARWIDREGMGVGVGVGGGGMAENTHTKDRKTQQGDI